MFDVTEEQNVEKSSRCVLLCYDYTSKVRRCKNIPVLKTLLTTAFGAEEWFKSICSHHLRQVSRQGVPIDKP